MTEPTPMSFEELTAALVDTPVRIDHIINLRCAIVDGAPSDAIEDVFEMLEERDLQALWPDMSGEARAAFLNADGDWQEVEMWIEDLRLFGYLVQVTTPVRDKHGSYSWGFATGKLFYAGTIEEAFRAGLEWAQATHRDALEKSK